MPGPRWCFCPSHLGKRAVPQVLHVDACQRVQARPHLDGGGLLQRRARRRGAAGRQQSARQSAVARQMRCVGCAVSREKWAATACQFLSCALPAMGRRPGSCTQSRVSISHFAFRMAPGGQSSVYSLDPSIVLPALRVDFRHAPPVGSSGAEITCGVPRAGRGGVCQALGARPAQSC